MKRLDVGVVGAGRVGAVLGAALARAGHRVVAVSAGSAASLARAGRLLPEAAVLPADQVAQAAGLLLLAVPDDALGAVAAGLAARIRRGQIVIHTSGAHGVGVLSPVAGRGAVPLAVHPAMTFTGTAGDLDRLPGIAYGVTAAEAHRVLAEDLVRRLGGEPEWIAEAARPRYHAALAHGANHLVTLVNEAADLLRGAGVRHPDRILAPLLSAALDNALTSGDAALTGPVSRGDAGTVAKHLTALPEESKPAYMALARRTADRALAHGRLRATDAGPLLDVLASSPQEAADEPAGGDRTSTEEATGCARRRRPMSPQGRPDEYGGGDRMRPQEAADEPAGSDWMCP